MPVFGHFYWVLTLTLLRGSKFRLATVTRVIRVSQSDLSKTIAHAKYLDVVRLVRKPFWKAGLEPTDLRSYTEGVRSQRKGLRSQLEGLTSRPKAK